MEGHFRAEAVERFEEIAERRLPPEVQLKYLGESRDYKETGNAVLYALLLVLVLVHLLMVAQFESFLHPFVILTSAPVALSGGLLTLWSFGLALNIDSQIGMIFLMDSWRRTRSCSSGSPTSAATRG